MKIIKAVCVCFPLISSSLYGALCNTERSEVGNDIELRLPFHTSESHSVTQGYCPAPDHSGYQVDFSMDEGTEVLAVAFGEVVELGTNAENCSDLDLCPSWKGDLKKQGGLFV